MSVGAVSLKKKTSWTTPRSTPRTVGASQSGWRRGATSFFFQAEDGIRDHCVTGVQTCALPISVRAQEAHGEPELALATEGRELVRRPGIGRKSEERRVGKECRSRWSPYH